MTNASRHRRGTRSLVWGLVLLALVAPVLMGIGIWVGVREGGDIGAANHFLFPDQRVTLQADRTLTVTADAGSLVPDAQRGGCTVTGPGAEVTFVPAVSFDSRQGGTLGEFRTDAAGDYRVVCPRYKMIKVTDLPAATRAARWLAVGVGGGIVVGGIAGIAGLILTVVGMLRLNARPRPAGAPGWVTYQ